MRLGQVKKFIVLLGAASTLSIVSISNLSAQNSDQYLQQIAQNTAGILQDVNNLPTYLQNAAVLVLSLINPDTSQATLNMTNQFPPLGTYLTTQTAPLSYATSLNTDLFDNDGNNVFNSNNGKSNSGSVPSNLWYQNDLAYTTLLGAYPLPPAQDIRIQNKLIQAAQLPYNYIRNASALNIFHKVPDPGWKQSDAKTRYQSYYNVVMSVESFDAYILGSHYADITQFTPLQNQLITQATDQTNWFKQVASENIGSVIRQILLYESQNFVLLTQLLQAQKQAVVAQALTHSLLIAINQMNENVMVSNAQGVKPQS